MDKAVAIVTGAGGDIGRAIAKGLVEDGYFVLAIDINRDAILATADSIGDAIMPVVADVTDPDWLVEIAKAEPVRKLTLLVNNAGGITSPSLQSATVADWRRDMTLNLEAAFSCFKAMEADLKANRGCVVNIASVNGLGTFGHPSYSAAKAGLIHFTRMLAVEYGKYGIRANAVAPGTVETQAWQARATANPQVFEDAKRWYPLQRVAKAEDVANAVRFLASDKAAAITGVCLPVDCGLMAGQTELAGTFSQSRDY